MVLTTTKSVFDSSNDTYPYLLAVSTNSLLIVNEKREFVEWVIKGVDKDAYLLSAPDEDTFLESLSLLKECIQSGQDPFDVYDFE